MNGKNFIPDIVEVNIEELSEVQIDKFDDAGAGRSIGRDQTYRLIKR